MVDFEWRIEDAQDLIRRDQRKALLANSPFPLAAALIALWLRSTAPLVAAVFLGMCMAWTMSLFSVWQSIRRNWRAYVDAQFRPLRVTLRDDGLTWEGPHGSRILRWEGVSVGRVGGTWVLRVGGRELAYLPGRVLSSEDAGQLEARLAG
jgi:hypothetical protein